MGKPMTRASLSEMTLDELRQVIREEFQAVVNETIEPRLSKMEKQMQELTQVRSAVSALEQPLSFTCDRIDDLYKVSLPTLIIRLEDVTSALAMRGIEKDVHGRKWALTIQGLKGAAGENESATRRSCIELAKDKLGIEQAAAGDFSACHRLKQEANAAIHVRFVDLDKRNLWLQRARRLQNHPEVKVSLSPDLPPVVRPLRSELLKRRAQLPAAVKAKSSIKYLRAWPFVELAVQGRDKVNHDIPQKSVVYNYLSMVPFPGLKEPTDTPLLGAQGPTPTA